jgi:hypothetical protein
MAITIQDASGNLWSVTTVDGLEVIFTNEGPGTAPNVYLNDPSGATSWLLSVVTISGTTEMETTAVTFNSSYPTSL